MGNEYTSLYADLCVNVVNRGDFPQSRLDLPCHHKFGSMDALRASDRRPKSHASGRARHASRHVIPGHLGQR